MLISQNLDDELISISDNDVADIKETICMLVNEYLDSNILDFMYPNLQQRLTDHIMPELELLYSPIMLLLENLNLPDIFAEGLIIYFSIYNPPRSSPCFSTPIDKQLVQKQLKRMRVIPQQVQNSSEWFDRRWNLLTASSAWKALGTDSMKNSLIYSKCEPIDKNKYSQVNINSATHHGHKFEPISLMFYEKMFNTEIEEFGCLPDQYNKILGASPDGINCKEDNDKFGYLLEIKNPVSRKLTGIPKLEYWIQMQFQMHVAQLPYCDFLETCFKQYETEENFDADGLFNKTALGDPKGVIVCFHDGNKPIYKYPPWNINKKNYEIWYDSIINENIKLTWINNTYWYLENYSCITVTYNKKWFDAAMPYFTSLWDTVVKERESGYRHRRPKKHNKPPPIKSPLTPQNNACMPIPNLALPPPKMVLKIRSPSFDSIN